MAVSNSTHVFNGSRQILISIIVAVFNGARTLQSCLDSIAAQTYSNIELIIIDGASTDDTIAIIEANKSIITYWQSEPDSGIYNAWNKGLAKTQGDWIYFLGADDYLWQPESIANMVNVLSVCPPACKVVYGQVWLKEGSLSRLIGKPWNEVRSKFQTNMTLPHQGLFHHNSLFKEHGLFNETFRIAGDYELLLRELINSNAIFAPEVIVAAMEAGGVSTRPETRMLMVKEFRLAQELNQLFKPTWGWRFLYLKACIIVLLNKLLHPGLLKQVVAGYRTVTRIVK